MANGDAAAALGWALVAGTSDKRLGYDEMNRIMDLLANHVTGFVQPITKGGTGATSAAAARTALDLRAINIPTDASNVQAAVNFLEALANGALAQAGSAAATANSAQGGYLSADIYSRALGSGYRVAYVRSDGVLGYASSSQKFKWNIQDADIPTATLRAILVRIYQLRVDVHTMGAAAPYELGVIAEELHDLGLEWLVDYDDKGKPFGVIYERIGLLALLLAQRAWDELDHAAVGFLSLMQRIDALETKLAGI